jgi:hypothetical protein
MIHVRYRTSVRALASNPDVYLVALHPRHEDVEDTNTGADSSLADTPQATVDFSGDGRVAWATSPTDPDISTEDSAAEALRLARQARADSTGAECA